MSVRDDPTPHPPPAGSDGTTVPVSLSADAEEFLVWLSAERGRAPATIAAYRRDLTAWEMYLGGGDTGTADLREPSVIDDWVAQMRSVGLAPSTVARRVVAVRSLYRFRVAEGLITTDPTLDVEQPRVRAGLPKALDERAVTALMDAPQGDGPAARRDRALLEILYGTGARVSEVIGISVGDIDLAGGTLRLFGKGSKERIVPLGGAAARAVAVWLDDGGRPMWLSDDWSRRDDAEAVFINQRGGRLSRQGAWGIVKRHARSVGIGGELSPHVLRHSCATHMLDHGADVRSVQELLGHASIGTTQVYTKVSAAHLRAAYDLAHPRARLVQTRE